MEPSDIISRLLQALLPRLCFISRLTYLRQRYLSKFVPSSVEEVSCLSVHREHSPRAGESASSADHFPQCAVKSVSEKTHVAAGLVVPTGAERFEYCKNGAASLPSVPQDW